MEQRLDSSAECGRTSTPSNSSNLLLVFLKCGMRLRIVAVETKRVFDEQQNFMLPRSSVAEHVRIEICYRTFAPPHTAHELFPQPNNIQNIQYIVYIQHTIYRVRA